MTVVMLTLLRDTETGEKPHSIKKIEETVTAEVGVVFTSNGERDYCTGGCVGLQMFDLQTKSHLCFTPFYELPDV